MRKAYLVTTREREEAALAFCEEEERYIELEEAEEHLVKGCRVTWLKREQERGWGRVE